MRHKHYDIILAWAEGKTIQCLQLRTGDWLDVANPCFDRDLKYRVKPREYKHGAFYPITFAGDKYIAQYCNNQGWFRFLNSMCGKHCVKEHQIDWIGEQIPESYWSTK